MILVKTVGDLGNLMFQYAFGFAVARRLKTTFCLNKLRELSFFELGGDSATANARRKLRFKLAALARRTPEKRWLDFNDGRYFSPETILADLADNTVYRGYFQSHRYYAGLETEVKNLFRVREPLRRRFEERYADYLRGTPLGVLHIRGKRHGQWDRIRMPWSYYENCLARVPDPDKYRWVAVTDDLPFARENLPAGLGLEVVSGDVIDDFQLMNRAAVHIMANSTFSWWAAYLNPNPAARIMAPNYWWGHLPEYRFEAPEGIMYPGWEWVDTTNAPRAETA